MSICLARTTSTQQPNVPKSCIRATLHSVKLFTELCLAHAHNNFLVTDLRRKIAIAINKTDENENEKIMHKLTHTGTWYMY